MLLLWPPTYRLWPASILSTCGSSPSLQQEIACQLSRRIQPSPFFHIKPIPHSLIICHLFNPLSYSHTSVSQSTLKLHSAVPFCNLVFFVNSKQKPFVCWPFGAGGAGPPLQNCRAHLLITLPLAGVSWLRSSWTWCTL